MRYRGCVVVLSFLFVLSFVFSVSAAEPASLTVLQVLNQYPGGGWRTIDVSEDSWSYTIDYRDLNGIDTPFCTLFKSGVCVREVAIKEGTRPYFKFFKTTQENIYLQFCYTHYSGENRQNGEKIYNPGDLVYGIDFVGTNIQDGVYITIPKFDGFMDSTRIQSFTFFYKLPVPASNKVSDVIIDISGGVEGTGNVISHVAKIIAGKVEGTCCITRELNEGDNYITIKVKSDMVSYSDTRYVIRVLGQVDEDGDGIDDRTGLPIWPEDPNNWDGATDGPPPLPGENATIFDYIKWFADSVLYSMGLLVTTIKGFMGGLGQISRIFGEIFSWIPKELIAIMILGLCMTVILRVVRR